MPDSFFSLQTLITLPGVALATAMCTQFLKGIVDNIYKTKTEYLAILIAQILMLFVSYFTTGLSGVIVFLDVINAILVGFSSIKLYETFNKDGKVEG